MIINSILYFIQVVASNWKFEPVGFSWPGIMMKTRTASTVSFLRIFNHRTVIIKIKLLINLGSRVRKSAQGVIHDHIMNFKLDFDILGVENSFQIQTLKTKTEYLDWVDDDEGLTTSYLATHYVENEDDARLDWPSNGDAMFLVGMSTSMPKQFRLSNLVAVNKDVQNKWGMSRGYRISPGAGSIHRTVSRESPFNKRNSNHAKTHVAITQQKDTEPSSSAAMNQNLAYDPLVH